MNLQVLVLLCVGGVLSEEIDSDIKRRTLWRTASPNDASSDNTNLLPLDEIVSIYGTPGYSMSDDDLQTVDDVLGITNDILDVGAAIEPIDIIFKPLSALGKLVLGCFNLKKREDPVMNKLDDISRQINQLGKQMNQQLADLKFYLSQTVFETLIMTPALLLNDLMQDTLKFPGNDSISKFYDAYKRYPPFFMSYKLMEFMQLETTNPLRKAMEADPLKTTKTFDKWSKTLLNVMFQFMYIETYANGMFDNSSLYGPHRLEDKFHDLNATILDWKRYYLKLNWPTTVKQMVENVQDSYEHASNDQKVRIITDRLPLILQEDKYIYYVVVYDEKKSDSVITGINYLVSFNRAKCHAMIMRTTKSRSPNWHVVRALDDRTVLERHKKKKEKNRAWNMMLDSQVYNPTASNNAIVIGGKPAMATVGPVNSGKAVFGWNAWWIATF